MIEVLGPRDHQEMQRMRNSVVMKESSGMMMELVVDSSFEAVDSSLELAGS